MQQSSSGGEAGGADGVGEQTAMTDAHVTVWQGVQQEAACEGGSGDAQRAELVVVGAVSPEERDVAVLHGDQALVADRDPV